MFSRVTLLHLPNIWNLCQQNLNDRDITKNHTKAANKNLNFEMGVEIQVSGFLLIVFKKYTL